MFIRCVNVLVWLSSLVGVGFGIYHHVKIYDPFVLVSAMIYVAIVIATRWLHPNRKLTAIFQIFLIVNMVLNGLGTNGLYRTSLHYDDLVHFTSPAMLMFAGLLWQDIRRKPFWPAVVFTIVVSFGWEPTEIVLDAVLKTHTYGQEGQDLDTVYDIIMDISGIGAVAIVFYRWRTQIMRWLVRK